MRGATASNTSSSFSRNREIMFASFRLGREIASEGSRDETTTEDRPP
jgi:hypothetical protein